jgi:TPP-dependent indolepyruvate ferredoxin oxidoreductase alpha subunit
MRGCPPPSHELGGRGHDVLAISSTCRARALARAGSRLAAGTPGSPPGAAMQILRQSKSAVTLARGSPVRRRMAIGGAISCVCDR